MVRTHNSFNDRAFRLHYGGIAATVDVCASVMALVQQVAIMLAATMRRAPAMSIACFWIRVTITTATLILYRVLGREQYIISIGLNSVWQRLFFATGLVLTSRPHHSKLSAMMWNHRLLFVHLALVARRTPAVWYWIGGIISWLAAAAVDVADPAAVCMHSLPCLLAAFQAHAVNTPSLMQDIMWAALRSSRELVIDVVLPGLLLTWLELRAYTAWLQQQQQQPRLQEHHEQPQGYREHCSAAPQSAGASCSQKRPPGARAAPDGQIAGVTELNSQVHDSCALGQSASKNQNAKVQTQLQHPNPASFTAVTNGTGGALALADGSPHGHTAEAAGAAPAAASGNCILLSFPNVQPTQQQHHKHPLLYQSPCTRYMASVKVVRPPATSLHDLQQFQNNLTAALQAAARMAPPLHQTAHCVPADHKSNGTAGPAAIVAEAAGFPGCYQVVCEVLTPAPFNQASGRDAQQNLLHLQKQLAAEAQHVVTAWPACGGLMGLALGQLQSNHPPAEVAGEAEHKQLAAYALPSTVPVPSALHTTEVAACYTVSAAVGAGGTAGTANGIHMLPVAAAVPLATSPANIDSLLNSEQCTSSSRAVMNKVLPEESAAAVEVQVCLTQSVVRQLLAAGQSAVRVVVAQQQPAGELLLDKTYNLSSMAVAGSESMTLGCLMELQVPLTTAALAQQQTLHVFNVVVLEADSVCEHNRAGYTAAETSEATAADEDRAAGITATSTSVHGVLAKLPLLVLPTGAAKEVQELYAALVRSGLSRSGAYQQVLPLLQDWAALLCVARTSGLAAEWEFATAVTTALEGCFTKHGLLQCQQLLCEVAAVATVYEADNAAAAGASELDSQIVSNPGTACSTASAAATSSTAIAAYACAVCQCTQQQQLQGMQCLWQCQQRCQRWQMCSKG